ncbi:bifunctional DNA primase/polymerase [Mycobacterium sp. M23085]|uniref:bifunctional DNA primase/polymerase n=1 Tax=Mycobacterium sp. M23085 TaxID=3378087 RepID=UPI003878098E
MTERNARHDAEATGPAGTAAGDVLGYGCAAQLYRDAGWLGVLPLPPREKVPHLAGFTGNDGAWPTDEQIAAWCTDQPADANLMLRVNYGVVGVDVDAYDGKTGGRTLEEAERCWGALPPTYRSSSRGGDAVSGIRVYRVPEGVRFRGVVKFGDLGIGDVETVQPHHRHITAWPSVHPTGGRYRWYGPEGVMLHEGQVPRVGDLPELPPAWIEHLSRDAARDEAFDGSAPNRTQAQRKRINEELYQRLIALPDDGAPPDRVVAARLDRAMTDLTNGTGNRYDTTRDHVAALMRLHAAGRAGVPGALGQLHVAYVLEVGDARPHPVAEAEFLRSVEGAAALVAASSAKVAERADGDVGPGDAWTFTDGASFVLDVPDEIPALWGTGQRVLWPEGESLMICGLPGVGKTTLAGMLVSAQLGGIGDLGDQVLGLPVAPVSGKILYLAMDRPQQIARSLHRQFDDRHRDALRERLVVWKGPPPADIAADPPLLARLAERAGASVVYLDSLKDAATGLADDAVGAGYNRARQLLLNRDVQLVELHHTTKKPSGGVADVFGSVWLSSGAGSIIMLTGQPGDPLVGFRHVKQPAEEVGPLMLSHDEDSGTVSILSSTDPVALAKEAGDEGITVRAVAAVMFDNLTPDKNEIEKARRKLNKLTRAGSLECIPGTTGGSEGGIATRWVAT